MLVTQKSSYTGKSVPSVDDGFSISTQMESPSIITPKTQCNQNRIMCKWLGRTAEASGLGPETFSISSFHKGQQAPSSWTLLVCATDLMKMAFVFTQRTPVYNAIDFVNSFRTKMYTFSISGSMAHSKGTASDRLSECLLSELYELTRTGQRTQCPDVLPYLCGLKETGKHELTMFSQCYLVIYLLDVKKELNQIIIQTSC